jgi:hypothetical protein
VTYLNTHPDRLLGMQLTSGRSSSNSAQPVVLPSNLRLYVPFGKVLNKASQADQSVHEAIERATAACMAERGLSYQPDAYQPAAPDPDLFSDLAWAKAVGYGIGLPLSAPPQESANDQALTSMTAKQQQTWKNELLGPAFPPGTPVDEATSLGFDVVEVPGGGTVYYSPDSCTVQGSEAVRGDEHAWRQAEADVFGIAEQTVKLATEDNRYRAGLARWRDCMKEHGYDYPAPRAAAEVFARERKPSDSDASDAERTVATADVTCYRSERLRQVRASLVRHYEAIMALRHTRLLTSVQKMRRDAIRAANR